MGGPLLSSKRAPYLRTNLESGLLRTCQVPSGRKGPMKKSPRKRMNLLPLCGCRHTSIRTVSSYEQYIISRKWSTNAVKILWGDGLQICSMSYHDARQTSILSTGKSRRPTSPGPTNRANSCVSSKLQRGAKHDKTHACMNAYFSAPCISRRLEIIDYLCTHKASIWTSTVSKTLIMIE